MFKELKGSGQTGKAIVKFLKSKDAGRVVVKGNKEEGALGTFTSNSRSTIPKFGPDGNEISGEKEVRINHPEISNDFSDATEIGGVLNIDLKGINEIRENPFDTFVEEATHAALFGAEATANGSNLNVDLPGGNDEFTAKAIVGQIENESGRKISAYSNDSKARAFGVQAFRSKSAAGFYPAALSWQKDQTGIYRRRRLTDKVPSFLKQLLKN